MKLEILVIPRNGEIKPDISRCESVHESNAMTCDIVEDSKIPSGKSHSETIQKTPEYDNNIINSKEHLTVASSDTLSEFGREMEVLRENPSKEAHVDLVLRKNKSKTYRPHSGLQGNHEGNKLSG